MTDTNTQPDLAEENLKLRDALENLIAKATGDYYTDAPECEEAVTAIHDAIAYGQRVLDGGPGAIPERVRSVVIDLIDEATNTPAWEDALDGEDDAMMSAVTAACELVEIEVPGQPDFPTRVLGDEDDDGDDDPDYDDDGNLRPGCDHGGA